MNKVVSKVVLVGNTAWSMYNFRLGLIKALVKQGIKVIIFAPKDDYSDKLVATGCEVHDLKLNNYSLNPFHDIATFIQLIKLYKEVRPDFSFHYTVKPNIYGTLAATYCGIPSIAITTGLGHLFKNKFITYISTILYRLAGKFSKEIWFLNKEDMNLFFEKRIVSIKKSFLLHSEGVNTSYFAPVESDKNEDKIIFLYAGRILKDKGIEILVEATRKLKENYNNFEVQILGFIDENNPNGITKRQIEEWESAELIKYMGETDDVRTFIANSDCIAFPSFYKEGVSRILLEAASMAKPIITTDWVGCREVVEDGVNGFLCKVKDVKSLGEKLEKFINLNEKERLIMGRNGRKKVLREFEEQKIIYHYFNTLKIRDNDLITLDQLKILDEC